MPAATVTRLLGALVGCAPDRAAGPARRRGRPLGRRRHDRADRAPGSPGRRAARAARRDVPRRRGAARPPTADRPRRPGHRGDDVVDRAVGTDTDRRGRARRAVRARRHRAAPPHRRQPVLRDRGARLARRRPCRRPCGWRCSPVPPDSTRPPGRHWTRSRSCRDAPSAGSSTRSASRGGGRRSLRRCRRARRRRRRRRVPARAGAAEPSRRRSPTGGVASCTARALAVLRGRDGVDPAPGRPPRRGRGRRRRPGHGRGAGLPDGDRPQRPGRGDPARAAGAGPRRPISTRRRRRRPAGPAGASVFVEAARWRRRPSLLARSRRRALPAPPGTSAREAAALVPLSTALSVVGRTEECMATVMQAVDAARAPSGRHSSWRRHTTRACGGHMLARERDVAVDWGDKAIVLATEIGDDSGARAGAHPARDRRCHGRPRRGPERSCARASPSGGARDLPASWRSACCRSAPGAARCGATTRRCRRSSRDVAYSAEHAPRGEPSATSPPGSPGAASTSASGTTPRSTSAMPLGGARASLVVRFVALNTLGWLRARRGEVDAWPVLDEALDIARTIGHLQRLWPVAVARAEGGWLEGSLAEHVPLLEEVLDLAVRCRHRVPPARSGCGWRGPVDPSRSRMARSSRSPGGLPAITSARRAPSAASAVRTRRPPRSPTPATRGRCVRRSRRSTVLGRRRWPS